MLIKTCRRIHAINTQVNIIMSVLQSYPNIPNEAVDKLEKQVIEAVRIYISNMCRRSVGEPELEIRLGHLNGKGKFLSGISEVAWRRVRDTLNAHTRWMSITDWREIYDFFYTIEDEVQKKPIQIRTTRYIDEQGDMQFDHFQKNKVSECTVNISNVENIASSARVSFATETPYRGKLPDIASTDCIRIKNRKSYHWVGTTGAEWVIDISKVWTDKTQTQTTRLRDLDDNKIPNTSKDTYATFEVEIECVNAVKYFQEKGNTNRYIALSCLMKIIGLLPEQGNRNKPVEISL